MLEQAGVAINWYAFFTSAGVAKTGLSPTITVYKDTSGTPEVNAASMTELAGGFYYYTQTPSAEGFRVAKCVTTDATVDAKNVPAIMFIGKAGIEHLDSIGTPVALDSGTATLAGMLTKMADDNGGASFDATNDSLNKIKTTVVAGVAATLTATVSTETTGTLVSGTYASTALSNGTYYIAAPVTPAVAESGTTGSPFGLNVSLTYGAAATQQVASVTIRGYYSNATGTGRYCNVYAYNYTTAAWDMLSDSITRMNHATTNQNYTYTLLSSHRKADGEIKIGFKSPSVTTGDRLNIDQCIVNVATASASAAEIADAVWLKTAALNYAGGVTIDTVAGTAGTSIQAGNGSPTNPVLTYADALTIAANLGVKRFYLRPGSSITLTQAHEKWRFIGAGTIALNSQSIADSVFEDCYTISGVSSGDDCEFIRCGIGTATIAHGYFHDCKFKGVFTMLASQVYFFLNCSDTTDAATACEFTYAASAEALFRNWRGGIQINNHKGTNDTVIDGSGRVVIDATSTAGSITIRGSFAEATGASTFTNAPNTGTITQTARYATDQPVASVTAAVTATDVSSIKAVTDKLDTIIEAIP